MRRALRIQEKGTGLRVAWPGVTFRVLAGYLAPLSRGSFCGHRVVAVVKNELVLCWAKAIGDCVSWGKADRRWNGVTSPPRRPVFVRQHLPARRSFEAGVPPAWDTALQMPARTRVFLGGLHVPFATVAADFSAGVSRVSAKAPQ